MSDASSPAHRNQGGNVTAAVVLFALVASVAAVFAAAPPASGDTTGDARKPGKHAAGYGGDRGPAPRAVREWAAAWNTGDAGRMAALFTEDGAYEDHAFQVEFRGRDGIAQWVEITAGSIDDARVEVHEAFRHGDRIAVEWTFSGEDTAGGLAGQPPTGKSFSVPAASFFEVEGNKIRRVEDYYNLADLLRQLGLPADAWTPPPAP